MTFTGSEQSVQSGAPLELYRFTIGGSAGAPVPGAFTEVLFADDFESYANTAAMLAAWPFLENAFVGATCELDPTGGVAGGKALKITVPSGEQSDHTGAYAYHDVTGLTTADKILTAQVRLDTSFLSDPIWNDYGIGMFQPGGAIVFAAQLDTYQTLTLSDPPRTGSGHTFRVALGWGVLSYFAVQSSPIWFDNVQLLGASGSGDPTAATVVGYTSADVSVTYNAEVYAPAIILRSPFQTGKDETGGSELEISIPRDHALATTAGSGPPRPPVSLQVLRLHRADLTAAITPWRGQVVGSRFEGARCILRCASVRALLDRKVPRYLTQKACGHGLYDTLCQASRILNTRGPFNVSAIDGRTVTVDGAEAAASGRVTGWPGGILVAPDGTLGLIEGVVGDVLTLKQALPTLAVSDDVSLIFGCNKTPASCAGDFANMRHFGGEPVMPIRNPGTGVGLVGTDGGTG